MSNTNGLISTPGVFYTGDSESNIYLRKGLPIVTKELDIQDGAGNSAVFSLDQTGNLKVVTTDAIIFDPNGVGDSSITLSSSGSGIGTITSSGILQLSSNGSATQGIQMGQASNPAGTVITPINSNTSYLAIQAIPKYGTITANSNQGVGIGYERIGCCSQVIVTGATSVLSIVFGNNTNPVIAGLFADFIILGGACTAGAQVQFIQGGTTFYTYTIPTGGGPNQFVRCGCDGQYWWKVTF